MFSVAEKFNSSYFWTLVQEDSWMCQLLINCPKFSGKLGFNFGVGLWMLSHKKTNTHCPGMEIVDLLESLDLHNTTFAGLQQKPGPHSHHPAALFSGAPSLQVDSFNLHHPQFHGRCWWSATFPGVERSVYYSAHARDRVASLIQSSQEFAFVTSIR